MSSTADSRIVRLTVYARRYCHLCDDMIAALRALEREEGFTFEVVDVDAESEWEARYGELVPVLAHGDTRICHYFLDRTALTAYLSAFR